MRNFDFGQVEKPLRWWIAVLTFVAVAALLQSAGAAERTPFEDPSQLRPVAQMVEDAKAFGDEFPVVDLFEFRDSAKSLGPATREALTDGTILTVKAEALKGLMSRAPETLTLPLDGLTTTPVEIELVRVNIFAEGFKVVTSSSNGEAVDYQPGLHYRGTVKGDPSSIAAFSFFDDEVAGLYSASADGDVVVGKLRTENKHNHHVLYAVDDMKSRSGFKCGVGDEMIRFPQNENDILGLEVSRRFPDDSNLGKSAEKARGKYARIYLETDYDLYQDADNSVENVVKFITTVFGQSATLFGDLGVPIVISEIFVWDTLDDYSCDAIVYQPFPMDCRFQDGYLGQFKAYRTSFNGDLAHLVNTKKAYVPIGKAEIGGLCKNCACNDCPNPDWCKMGISMIPHSEVPAYADTTHIFTHELGHQFGSQHTHACIWNGDRTPIDGCAGPEAVGTLLCSIETINTPLPGPGGGTVMSYCNHPENHRGETNPGVSFANGFHSQPGYVIRAAFDRASCLDAAHIMQVSYVENEPAQGQEFLRSTRSIIDSQVIDIDYFYDESRGKFEHRPTGRCFNGNENPTYLKIRFDTPGIAACMFKTDFDPAWITCQAAHVSLVNSGEEIIINTNDYLTDPTSQYCYNLNPPVPFLPAGETKTFYAYLKVYEYGQWKWVLRSFNYTKK